MDGPFGVGANAAGSDATRHAGSTAVPVKLATSGRRPAPWLFATVCAALLILTSGAIVFQMQSHLADIKTDNQIDDQLEAGIRLGRLTTSLASISVSQVASAGAGALGAPLDEASLTAMAIATGIPAPQVVALQQAYRHYGASNLASFTTQVQNDADVSQEAVDQTASLRAALTRHRYKLLLITSSLALVLFISGGLFIVGYMFEQVETERKLGLARRSVLRAERDRANTVAMAGHDLRQPLQAISLFAATIAHRNPDGETQTLLKKIDIATGSMHRMISGLLDVSKLDAGLMSADLVDTKLSEVFATLGDEFTQRGEEKGLALHVEDTREVVNTDPLLLETILRNLISNAIRYSVQGRIDVTARRAGSTVVIAVADTGPGIAMHEVNAIFQDFYRVGRNSGGLGLGLGIVRRVAELLRVEISVDSTVGKGSKFSFALPLGAGEATLPPPVELTPPVHAGEDRTGPANSPQTTARSSLRPAVKPAVRPLLPATGAIPPSGNLLATPATPLRVLLVEDDPGIRDAMSGQLRVWGMEVIVAANGRDGQAILNDPATPLLDITIVDFELGDTTGVEVLEVLPRRHPQCQGMVITGSQDSARIELLCAGRYVCLRKPVVSSTLHDTISRLLAAR